MTTIVSAMYPSQGSRFDLNCCLSRQMPVVQEKLSPTGLPRWEALRGAAAPGVGTAAYRVVANLTFDSSKKFEGSIAAHGKQMMGDIPSFTDARPVIQVSKVIGGT